MNILQKTIGTLTLGPATSFAGLTVFPLLAKSKGERGYLTLDDAMALGTLKITETSKDGNVPELLLTNDGKQAVLLVDGEELTGAKQNRVLNLTVLAPAGKEIVIPVSCVEAGRWSANSPDFASADRVMFSSARRNKVHSVSHAYMMEGAPVSDQSQVWDDIAIMSNACEVRSPTSEMGEIYRAHRRSIDEYVAAFPPVENQAGAVFAIAGKIQGMEVFDHSQTLADLLPKLVRSYALDAMEVAGDAHPLPEVDDAKMFMADVEKAETTELDAVGLGKDLRLSGNNLAGGALVVDGTVVHMCVFRDESEEGNGSRDDRRGNEARREGRMMRSTLRRRRG